MTYESRKNRSDLFKILLIAAVVIGAYLLYKNRPITHDAIAGLPDPIQGKMSAMQKLTAGDFNVTMEYVATYHIDALVVHTKDYRGSSLPDLLSPKHHQQQRSRCISPRAASCLRACLLHGT